METNSNNRSHSANLTLQVLTPQLRATLASAVDRILPECGKGPGALAAGSFDFIVSRLDKNLSTSTYKVLFEGLGLLDDMAQELYGQAYASCSSAAQDDVLHRVQRVPHALPRRFFRLLVHLTLQGFLCHPRHGGNKEHVGWKWIGFTLNAETEK